MKLKDLLKVVNDCEFLELDFVFEDFDSKINENHAYRLYADDEEMIERMTKDEFNSLNWEIGEIQTVSPNRFCQYSHLFVTLGK